MQTPAKTNTVADTTKPEGSIIGFDELVAGAHERARRLGMEPVDESLYDREAAEQAEQAQFG